MTLPSRSHVLPRFAVLPFLLGAPPLAAQMVRYTATRTDTVVDKYLGTPVPAPYRWLEDTTSVEVARWLDAQADVTTRYLASLGLRKRIAQESP